MKGGYSGLVVSITSSTSRVEVLNPRLCFPASVVSSGYAGFAPPVQRHVLVLTVIIKLSVVCVHYRHVSVYMIVLSWVKGVSLPPLR